MRDKYERAKLTSGAWGKEIYKLNFTDFEVRRLFFLSNEKNAIDSSRVADPARYQDPKLFIKALKDVILGVNGGNKKILSCPETRANCP